MPTVSASYLKCFVETCLNLGVQEAKLLDLIPGKSQNLNDSDARFPVGIVYDVFKLTLNTADHPAIGLETGQYFTPGTHGEAGRGLMACPTLRKGSEFLGQYEGLMQQYGGTHVTADDDYTWVHWNTHPKDHEIDLILTDASIVHHIKYLRWLTQDNDMDVKLVHLRRDAPEHADLYRDVFGCQVKFEQQKDAIALDKEMIDFALPQGNENLLRGICKRLEISMKLLTDRQTLAQRTALSIENLMPKGNVGLPTIAADLGLSDRNFRRLLQEEDTSFRTILQETRRKMCEQYLIEQGVPLTEIAERLCYSEQSAFTRAFKAWYGRTPKAYANDLLAAQAK